MPAPYSSRWRLSAPFTMHAKEAGELCTPHAWALPCGDLLVDYSDDGDFYFARSGMLRSRNGGRTWQHEGEALSACGVLALDDRLVRMYEMLSFGVKNSPGKFLFRYRESTDGGRSFGPIRFGSYENPGETQPLIRGGVTEPHHTIWQNIIYWEDVLTAAGWEKHEWLDAPGGFHGPSYFTRFVRLGDGSLVHVVNLRNDHPDPGKRQWHLHLLRSTDNGVNWEHHARVTPDEHPPGVRSNASEGCPVRLADGRIYMVYRYPPDYRKVRQMWSEDDGKTWSEPTAIGDRACGVFPNLVKLSDGALALLHGRPGMWLTFDPTGTGEAWEVGHRLDLTRGEDVSIRNNARPTLARLDLLMYRRYHNPFYATWCRPDLFAGYYYSWENVNAAEVSPGRMLIVYDVQNWVERAGDVPRKAIRGVWAVKEDAR